jgi:hypothetical protein
MVGDHRDVTNGELRVLLEEIGKDVAEVKADVKNQNGRVYRAEAAIEKLTEKLQERREDARDLWARWFALVAVLVGLAELIAKVLKP